MKALISLLLLTLALQGQRSPTTRTVDARVAAAEQLIDAFYSFDRRRLADALAFAPTSAPAILFYQGWAEGGHYRVKRRAPCVPEAADTVRCDITVEDDLIKALGLGLHVTDTFHITFSNGRIGKVTTSSNDPPKFDEAMAWVRRERADAIKVPCEGFFAGGATPQECVRAMVKGFAEFAAQSRIVENIGALGRIDPSARYLFYLHARVVEDVGLPAVSERFGEFRYHDILARLAREGYTVISEVRPKDASSGLYARRTAAQVRALLDAGVPASHITVIGASKGAYITALVSHETRQAGVGYVILAMCDPDTVAYMIKQGTRLHGDVLAIRDAADADFAGPCAPLFSASPDIGATREIVVEVGTGHGIVFRPIDEWVLPALEWAAGKRPQPRR